MEGFWYRRKRKIVFLCNAQYDPWKRINLGNTLIWKENVKLDPCSGKWVVIIVSSFTINTLHPTVLLLYVHCRTVNTTVDSILSSDLWPHVFLHTTSTYCTLCSSTLLGVLFTTVWHSVDTVSYVPLYCSIGTGRANERYIRTVKADRCQLLYLVLVHTQHNKSIIQYQGTSGNKYFRITPATGEIAVLQCDL
jgi:hypothetical protein